MTLPSLLKFGGYQPPESINTKAAARFLSNLSSSIQGRVACELVGNVLDLGRPSGALVPMVEQGELSFCYMSSVRFSGAVPELAFFELPFVVEDRGAVFDALDGEAGNRLKAGVEATTACRVLGFWDNGFRHLTNKVRPIRKPEDCQGLAIRTQMTPLHGEIFEALGFRPIAVDIKEFVEQIDSDRFDAQENPLANTYVFGVHKRHRYITLSAHLFGVSLLLCNQAQYESWPQDLQAAVTASAAEATRYQRQLAVAEDQEVLARLDPSENEVIYLSEAERSRFEAAVQPVLANHSEILGPGSPRLASR